MLCSFSASVKIYIYISIRSVPLVSRALTTQRQKANHLAEAHIECGEVLGHAVLGAHKDKHTQVVGMVAVRYEQIVWQVIVAQPFGEPMQAGDFFAHYPFGVSGCDHIANGLRGRLRRQAVHIIAGQRLQLHIVYVQVVWYVHDMEMQVIHRSQGTRTVVAQAYGPIVNVPHEIDTEAERRQGGTLHQIVFDIGTDERVVFGQRTLVDNHLHLGFVLLLVYGHHHLQSIDFIEIKLLGLKCGTQTLNRLWHAPL